MIAARKAVFVLLVVLGVPVTVLAQGVSADSTLGIANANRFDSGIIVGTRVTFPAQSNGPYARVQLSGGYAVESGIDLLATLDYETQGSPLRYQQIDRVYIGGVFRRSVYIRDGMRVRSGVSLVQGVDMDRSSVFEYASGEMNMAVIREFYLGGSLEVGMGVGAFIQGTERWSPQADLLHFRQNGVFAGVYVPVEITFKLFGHRLTIDRGLKLGYDRGAGGLAVRMVGRGPLHSF